MNEAWTSLIDLYEIAGPHGPGGTGTVVDAIDRLFGNEVAIISGVAAPGFVLVRIASGRVPGPKHLQPPQGPVLIQKVQM